MPINALAATWQQSFTLPYSTEYESNPRLASNNTESARRNILNPSYSLTATQDNDEFFADLKLNIERSSNQSASADREDPSLSAGWARTYDKGQFGITANYSERSTRFSEFDDNGQVANNNTRQTSAIGSNWSTALSDRYSLSVNVDYTSVEFDTAGINLRDYDNKSINTQLNYSIDETVESFARLSLSRFEPIANTATNFRSVDIGATWSLSEHLNVTASGGINETGGSNGESGWQASIEADYTTERNRFNASLSRSRAPSGAGIIRESNQLSVGWTHNWSDKENIGLNFNYRENLSINPNDTMHFSADYTRALAQSWDFKLSAKYRNRDNDFTDVSSNTFTATIIYKLPNF